MDIGKELRVIEVDEPEVKPIEIEVTGVDQQVEETADEYPKSI